MATQRSKLLATLAGGCLAAGLAAQLPAYAAPPGAGTWTRVTSPISGATFLSQSGHQGQLTVKGLASDDVSTVAIYCLAGSGSSVDSTTVATPVPVASGAFTATVTIPETDSPQCRLRALPLTVNPQTAYLASYAGPVVNFDSWQYFPSQDTFALSASSGDGMVEGDGVGVCSSTFLGTVLSDETVPGGSQGCFYRLGEPEFHGTTHSTVRVDGHEAYTTGAALGFGLTPTHLSTHSFHVWKGSGLRWTEIMPVDRCASGDTFPPTSGSCPTLVSSGIEIAQVWTYLPAGHQLLIRTAFRSADGKKHALRLDYSNTVGTLSTGEPGYLFPGQHTFHASTSGEAVTALGSAAGTMLVRNDRFSTEGDPAAATHAMTWSRTPSSIHFSSLGSPLFTMSYALTVPRGGAVHLGFTDSDSPLTSVATRLGARAEAGMMPSPRITVPVKGAVIKGKATTVKGTVTSGANGLPVSITVNGHAATLKPNKAQTRATYAVTFTESLGKHTLRVVAKDAVGNSRTASVVVTNK